MWSKLERWERENEREGVRAMGKSERACTLANA